MVHALEKAVSCLNSEGVILEIHDLVDPPRIEVHSDKGELFAGQLLSDNNFENQRLADQAINQVIASGQLSSDRSVVFENFAHADTIASLTNWLEEEWESAYIPADSFEKVNDLVAKAGEKSEVVLRLISRLNLLRPGSIIK
jgi:hypothetical protein